MKRLTSQAAFRKLEKLYADMVAEYDAVCAVLGHTCKDCSQNCCTSYFQHHTYIEWAFLWEGLNALPQDKRAVYEERAKAYVKKGKAMLADGKIPDSMCPLNDDGLCGMYRHRLMICRMHGVPNFLVRPDGRRTVFSGCWLSQELTRGKDPKDIPYVDRTPLYRRLVALEQGFLGTRFRTLPKVDLNLAEMILAGPPQLRA
ncbi:MAG: hypothetical protein ACNI3A_17465 [Desulfovibrio sp.]|uniref:hypothetical protein n=1 Tax=Desulfovibrio sp. 7SRBS1 TaxID=3378064 RepID=UPI003B414345